MSIAKIIAQSLLIGYAILATIYIVISIITKDELITTGAAITKYPLLIDYAKAQNQCNR